MKRKIIGLLLAIPIFSLIFGSALSMGLVRAKAETKSGPSIYNPRFYSPDSDNIYFEGQQVKIHVNYHETHLKVVADLSVLDKSMPKNMPVRDNQTGTYTLITPALSGETMVIGKNIAIPFTATDQAGNTATRLSTYTVEVRTYPLKYGAKIQAPEKVVAESLDEAVKISWSPLKGAERVLVRYSDPSGNPRQLTVPGNYTYVIVRNLENGYKYNFIVAGQYSSKLTGSSVSVFATPVSPKVEKKETATEQSSEPVVTKKKTAPKKISSSTTVAPKEQVKPELKQESPEKIAESNVEEIKDLNSEEQDKNNDKNWNRLILAIAILIIAAGGSIGGYYGYEWYLARKEEPLKEKTRSKSRW